MVKLLPGVTKKALTHNLKLYRSACASVNRQISKDDETKPKGISTESFDEIMNYATGQFIIDIRQAFNITEKTFVLFNFLIFYASVCVSVGLCATNIHFAVSLLQKIFLKSNLSGLDIHLI